MLCVCCSQLRPGVGICPICKRCRPSQMPWRLQDSPQCTHPSSAEPLNKPLASRSGIALHELLSTMQRDRKEGMAAPVGTIMGDSVTNNSLGACFPHRSHANFGDSSVIFASMHFGQQAWQAQTYAFTMNMHVCCWTGLTESQSQCRFCLAECSSAACLIAMVL